MQDGDLAGGYYDAGGTGVISVRYKVVLMIAIDYIKCTFPLSFSLMSICWGAIDFGQGVCVAVLHMIRALSFA